MENNDKDVMEMLIRINKMIGPKGNYEDRGGHCEFIDFVEEIKNLPIESKEREIFERALRLCAQFLSSMPRSHISNLLHLICSSKTPIGAYGEDFLKAFNGWIDGGGYDSDNEHRIDNLLQKAEILRHLAEKKCFSSAKRIIREQKIREGYPWLWIDAMSKYDIEETIKEAEMCIRGGREDNEVQNLLMRLPGWISLWGADRLASIRKLRLVKSNKEKIEASFEVRRKML